MNFYNVTRLAPGRAGMRARSMGFWLAKSMIMHGFTVCTMKANIFPLGNGWEYGSDIAGVGIPSNSLCQGLTPSVTLPLLASAAQHTNMLKSFPFLPKKKKPFQKCDMLFIREKGRINGKN